MALNKQVNIYSVDTCAFFTPKEQRIHARLCKLKSEKRKLKVTISKLDLRILVEFGADPSSTAPDNKRYSDYEYTLLSHLLRERKKYFEYEKRKNQLIGKVTELLTGKFKKRNASNALKKKPDIRELNQNHLIKSNIVSIFSSSQTRTLKMITNDLSIAIMIVKIFYFDVFKDIMLNGFMYGSEKYKCLTASAGQIRKKKIVCIKEDLWREYEKTFMCGLTIDLINKKGGVNINKFLAYLALGNSATDVWEGFNIEKSIVVPDFETNVFGTVDYIDDETYEVKRIDMPVPIPHMDGCGICNYGNKNFMARLPWIKGLMAVFRLHKWILEKRVELDDSTIGIVKDIYGKEHDIIAEDIQIIFTESQFKMHKFYESWDEYIHYFKKYNCEAGVCNVEEDRIPNAKINYQMLQTLTDITDDELAILAEKSNNKITNIASNKKTMLEAFGVTPYNQHKTHLQQALELYPELLNDVYTRDTLKAIKKSLYKKYRSGKLEIKGKYTFIIPDLYAFCENLFLHKEIPDGLLKEGEVYCRLYKNEKKLDCLRSPHLYKEHAVRSNVVTKDISKWFITDALYTSSHDLISKILQFDCDGDKSLVVADQLFVQIAERNMVGIVPLYYNMRKAAPTLITPLHMYEGMTDAYTGGNIGSISNDISKIWNSDVWIDSNAQEKEQALLAIKLLCMENNFTIDYAKTLYKPTRPDKIDKLIKRYTNSKLPNFFLYAKDKEEKHVESVNDSVVNRLKKIIVNKRICFKSADIGILNYELLMKDTSTSIDKELINDYIVFNRSYHYMLNMEDEYCSNISYLAKDFRNTLSEKYRYSDDKITDILVKYLYGKAHSKSKESLWFCYGENIVNNLKNKLNDNYVKCPSCNEFYKKMDILQDHNYCPDCIESKLKQNTCVDCGKTFFTNSKNQRQNRCDSCKRERRLAKERARLKKYYSENSTHIKNLKKNP